MLDYGIKTWTKRVGGNMSNILSRDTIGDMARRAATKYGHKTALIFRDQVISYYDLERYARRFAHLMVNWG